MKTIKLKPEHYKMLLELNEEYGNIFQIVAVESISIELPQIIES